MPYSMMCRASTSETSSLSGSGIFFFSSTGRLGGCAGCGCSSSSSYRDTSPRHLRPPQVPPPQGQAQGPQGQNTLLESSAVFRPSHYPGMCHASSWPLLIIAQFTIFSFPSTERRDFFLKLPQGIVFLLLTVRASRTVPPSITKCIRHAYSWPDQLKAVFHLIL